MALMSEERRREMEEEMSRFEQEIALPGSPESSPSSPAVTQTVKDFEVDTQSKCDVPAPGVSTILPSVLRPPPPPPPPPASPPKPPHLHHPLPPPPPPPSSLQPPPMVGAMRFIPPQLRQPPRPPVRPFLAMRVPIGFQPHVPMPFAPLHPHPPHMPPLMGPIGVSLPMPPGFCPPGPPMPHLPNMRPASEPYVPSIMPGVRDDGPENLPSEAQMEMPKDSEMDFGHLAAPAVYAAPPMKSQSEKMSEDLHFRNGDVAATTTVSAAIPQVADKPPPAKSMEEVVGGALQTVTNSEETNVSKKKEKKKKNIRMAGGQTWEDNSLIEWDPDDFRIFCGDLGNDVTDEVLIRAFSKYSSFVKAKVIRDKRTNKTKGYGFVSFKDPQDFIKAMREMNGRYVGSRPIKLRKSTWKDRNIEIVRKKQKEKEKLGLL